MANAIPLESRCSDFSLPQDHGSIGRSCRINLLYDFPLHAL